MAPQITAERNYCGTINLFAHQCYAALQQGKRAGISVPLAAGITEFDI
jgi:hypothetical protein